MSQAGNPDGVGGVSAPDVQGQAEPSTSVSTIRGLRHLETSFPDPISLSVPANCNLAQSSNYGYSSGHSAPSTPPSPSDSVSSFPSIASSFLFSSGPTSPPFPLTQPPSRSDLSDDARLHLTITQHTSESDVASDHLQRPESDANDLHDLVMPSLSLASSSVLPIPAQPGQAFGDISVLLLGPHNAVAELADFLLESEDVLERASWEDLDGNMRSTRGVRICVHRGSTDWLHQSKDGHLKPAPARNVEFVALSHGADDESFCHTALPLIHARFHALHDVLHPSASVSQSMVAKLCAAPAASLFMAAVLVSASKDAKQTVLATLGDQIPLIILPSSEMTAQPLSDPASDRSVFSQSSFLHSSSQTAVQKSTSSTFHHPPYSAFHPNSALELRDAVFHSSAVRTLLRAEAAQRFLHWRAIEQAVDHVEAKGPSLLQAARSPGKAHLQETFPSKIEGDHLLVTPTVRNAADSEPWTAAVQSEHGFTWDKARWEAEWEGDLSRDIALSLRRRRAARTPSPSYFTSPQMEHMEEEPVSLPCTPLDFDPLHLPSLLAESFSLLHPLRAYLGLGHILSDAVTDGTEQRQIRTVGTHGEIGVCTSPAARRARGHRRSMTSGAGFGLRLALMGAFCAGFGIGVLVARM
ncbi:hypothetical protein OBBRIDRAFT_887170 [Obba rivulosa]|uniref:Transmembrane protein n=1 Tax=Obba rivulosa TaxID=1052685 RepID=A0A8E2DK78_9APHY|nr:hypothetical protein OBBRIDRAFT_887170 [Obba rivulosa]